MACVQTRLPRAAVLVAASALLIGAAPSAPTCAPLRVMSFNIRLDIESDGVNRWSKRREQFIGQIAFTRPAILGLQELLPGQKADLEKALPGYQFVGVARDDGKAKGEYSAIAVDRKAFSVRGSGTFWLSPTPATPSKGWDAAYARIATWAHLVRRGDGRRIFALNTHLDNEGEIARREGASRIAAFLALRRLPGERVVVTGDFNAEPGSAPLRILTGRPLLLRDSRIAAGQTVGPAGTFNAFALQPAVERRIDYVLSDPALEVERSATLAWDIGGGRVASDHFAVVADLRDCR